MDYVEVHASLAGAVEVIRKQQEGFGYFKPQAETRPPNLCPQASEIGVRTTLMTQRLPIELPILLPRTPDARDACVKRHIGHNPGSAHAIFVIALVLKQSEG